jgi:hypothetical protein
VSRTGLQQKAWDLASKYGLPHTFYAQYLAVAEMEDCELWTANSRLFDSIKDKNNRIRLARDDTADKSARAGRTSEAKTTGGQDFPGLWQRI